MAAVRAACDKYNALMITDEIQAGIGRTGKMYAHQWYDVQPDIITVAKPLANGFPIGAVLVSEKVAEMLKPGDHGTTFGGGPFISYLAKVVLDTIDQPDFLKNVTRTGEYFKTKLSELAKSSPMIVDVRGHGLMLGIQFHESIDSKLFVDLCRDRKLLVVGAGCNTIRFVPPLIITEQQIDEAVEIMEDVVEVMEGVVARGKDRK